MTTIRELTPSDADHLVEFFAALSEEDRTFIREDLSDEAATRSLAAQGGLRWVAVGDVSADGLPADAAVIEGYSAVIRLPGWSDHVGELRLVTRPTRRRAGLGRALAQHALIGALRAGMRKVVVELAVDQEYAIAMFSGLGFTGEALLRDHIRDRNGQLRDLVVLAHLVDEDWSTLDTLGVTDLLLG
jgi:ribosomal protein S18 acetylase RimI-like enzyme